MSLVQQRKACIVGLHLSGFSTDQILQTVNNLGLVQSWGTITLRQVQRVLREHFDGRPLTAEQVKSAAHPLREAALSTLEQCLEDVSLYGFTARQNTPEFLKAMHIRAYIAQCLINFRGYNMSAKDYGKWNAGSPMPLDKFARGIEFAGGRQKVVDDMLNGKDFGFMEPN